VLPIQQLNFVSLSCGALPLAILRTASQEGAYPDSSFLDRSTLFNLKREGLLRSEGRRREHTHCYILLTDYTY